MQFLTGVWEQINKMYLPNEVTGFIGLNAELEETEGGFVADIEKPEDILVGFCTGYTIE